MWHALDRLPLIHVIFEIVEILRLRSPIQGLLVNTKLYNLYFVYLEEVERVTRKLKVKYYPQKLQSLNLGVWIYTLLSLQPNILQSRLRF